jgi:hypothetical protein|tara:strand:+ start:879 stop:1199 length:321 start_codon:yes stop_codon:yes gene_type:complete
MITQEELETILKDGTPDGFISRDEVIAGDGWKEVTKIIEGMKSFLDRNVRTMETRKDQAQTIFDSYGKNNRSGVLFKLLDNPDAELDKRTYKKLIYKVINEPEQKE